MLHVVTTGAYHPPVVTTWKILTTGTSYLTTGTLCSALLALRNLKCLKRFPQCDKENRKKEKLILRLEIESQ